MPRIVLVPGAWHMPTLYSPFTAALAKQGFIVDSIANKTLGSTTATVADDAAAHRQLILALVEAGHDVVVIAHSYGGVPAGIAAAGLHKATRSKAGLPGGIVGLIYISSFVLPERTTVTQATGGTPAPWIKIEGDTTWPQDPAQYFYERCTSQAAMIADKMIMPQAASFLHTCSDVVPAWKEKAFENSRHYLVCLQDKAIPAAAQRVMSTGWQVSEMDTDHSPFLSRTEETATWVKQTIEHLV